jgi:hypothetical protein
MRTVLLVIALAGCGSKSDAPDNRAACNAAIARGVDMTLEKRMARAPYKNSPDALKVMKELAPALKETLGGLCVSDKWSEQVITCFQTAPDIAKCKDNLKPEQRQKYSQEMMKVMLASQAASKGISVPVEPGSGSGSAAED